MLLNYSQYFKLYLQIFNILIYRLFRTILKLGEVSERLKEHVWNTCIHYPMYQGFESLPHRIMTITMIKKFQTIYQYSILTKKTN